MKLLENFLAFYCKIIFSIIYAVNSLNKFLKWIFELLLIYVQFCIAIAIIVILPMPWQLYVIKIAVLGSAFAFISIMGLAIWKPDRFEKVFSIIEKDKA